MASLMETNPSMERPSSLTKSPMPKYLEGGARRTRPKSRLQTKGAPSRKPVIARQPGAMALIRPLLPRSGVISMMKPSEGAGESSAEAISG